MKSTRIFSSILLKTFWLAVGLIVFLSVGMSPAAATLVDTSPLAITNPVPTVSSIYPTSGPAGGPAFVLTVAGTGFVSGSSTVRWKGANRVTTFLSSTKLRANILAADVATLGTAAITVFNAAPGGGTSVQAVSYTIGNPNPVPTVSAISPTSGPAGGAAFTLTVAGTGFVNGSSTVRWKGSNRVTTFVSSTKLRASILAADVATGGTAAITVFNAAPGGGTSVQTVSYAVLSPVPTVSSIYPTSGPAGGAAFTLTVAGTGFVSGLSTVRWNGANRVTTFVSSTKLRASILTADVAMWGRAAITVFTTAPGGGISVQTVSYTVGGVSQIPTTEYGALAALYHSTNGGNWTNRSGWLVTNTPCSWFGVSCLAGHVKTLNLHNNHLSGIIPSQLGSLTHLTYLYIGQNYLLTGGIPPELGSLTNLTDLILGNTLLSGSIPTQLGNLTNLTYLNLVNAGLTGSIPSELGKLTNLTDLILGSNKLSGSIPPQLGNLTKLEYIDISYNQLTGPMPDSLRNLVVLTSFYFPGTVCAPNSVPFLAWLNAIGYHSTYSVCP